MSISQQLDIGALRYFLYDRPLHPELFDIYGEQRLKRKHYAARLWVTGGQHVISFQVGDRWLTEVLADTEAELPEQGRLLTLPIRGEKQHETEAGGLRYMMNFQLDAMSPQVYEKMHEELVRTGGKRSLFVDYPDWPRQGRLQPFSLLDSEAGARHLHVFTYHAYPGDLTLVKMQSVFEIV